MNGRNLMTIRIIDLALTHGNDLRITYVNKEGEWSARTITPKKYKTAPALSVVLVAWCHLREAYRAFDVTAIQNIEEKRVSFWTRLRRKIERLK